MKKLSQENHIPDSSFCTLPVTEDLKFEKDQKPSFCGRYGIFIEILQSRAEEFGQNYVRSAATSVDKSENSPQFSYIILR